MEVREENAPRTAMVRKHRIRSAGGLAVLWPSPR
jgi:hypothetical protein